MTTDYDLRDEPKALKESLVKQVQCHLDLLETYLTTVSNPSVRSPILESIERYKLRTERHLSRLEDFGIFRSLPYRLIKFEFERVDWFVTCQTNVIYQHYKAFGAVKDTYLNAANRLIKRIDGALLSETRPKTITWLMHLNESVSVAVDEFNFEPDHVSGALVNLHHQITFVNGKLSGYAPPSSIPSVSTVTKP